MSTDTKAIGLNDFSAQWGAIKTEALAAVSRVGGSGWLILGKEVQRFERLLADYWGLSNAVGCASGLDALEIGLRCLGLPTGDKVLTSPLSAFATTLAIIRAGGVPVFVDVDESGLIDLDLCEDVLRRQPDIRYFVPVHLYGHALDADRLVGLRSKCDLRIVEDCAQAIGARSFNSPVGTSGQMAATSFYPTKNLGCMGDGGAVLTNDDRLARTAAIVRDYGQSDKYLHTHIGMNSRLDELQAAILVDALLPRLGEFTARRVAISQAYRDGIENRALRVPVPPRGSQSVWHLFPLLVLGDRAKFQAHLAKAGVGSGIHYPRIIPEQEALRTLGVPRTGGDMPRAREFASRELSIPIHPLLSEEQVARVIEVCNDWGG